MSGRSFFVFDQALLYSLKQILWNNSRNAVRNNDFPVAVFADVLPVFEQPRNKVEVDGSAAHRRCPLLFKSIQYLLHRCALVIHRERFQHNGCGVWVKLIVFLTVNIKAVGRCPAVVLALERVFGVTADHLLR